MKRFVLLTLAALFLFAGSGCKEKKASLPPRSVNIAIQPSAAFIPLYIARYKEYIEDELKPLNVTVVWQDFESGPPMNQSLAAGLSDIGVIGDVPTVTALSAGNAMKLVGIPASGPDAYAMLARADDKSFKSSADMKGKKIATVFGSTGHNFTTKLLEKNGLSFDQIEFISISAGEAANALESGVCDAIVIWEPNVTRLIDSGAAKVVALGSETDLRGTNGFVVRSEYLAENDDIIKVVLEQYREAVRDISSLDTPTLEKLSDALKITPEQTKKIAQKYDFSVKISDSDIAALQDTASFLVEIGNMDSAFNVSEKAVNLINP